MVSIHLVVNFHISTHLLLSSKPRFTKMTLPRSVKEMSKQDFLPRHCKSDHFRGFSFIGDHFSLPERTVSELNGLFSLTLQCESYKDV